ncbi:MAG: PRC-barrel domain-containing protein [Desulfobulbaceae bacterium]|nr:PRC-barrel domain-containing protein [Desulfobulbaceae bacterium]
MNKITVSVVAVLASFALATPLLAEGGDKQKTKTTQTGQMGEASQYQASNIPSADELKGLKVVSQQGEDLGEIKDVKMDPQSGRISHVTMSKGGILGIGGEDIAVPLGAFNFNTEQEEATLTVDQSKLDNAPQQAGMSDQEFNRELQDHYGVSPTWEQEQQKSPGMSDPTRRDPSMEAPGLPESTPGQKTPGQQDSPSMMEEGKSQQPSGRSSY